MNVLKSLLVVALIIGVATLIGSYDWNGRTDQEQYWYDRGHEFVGDVIEVDKVHDQDELMDACTLHAELLGLGIYGDQDPENVKWDAMTEGCYDRAHEEDPWD